MSEENPNALLEAFESDAEDVHLYHGDTAHLAYPLVVPTSQYRRTYSAVRHRDSQPYSETAKTPPVYTFP